MSSLAGILVPSANRRSVTLRVCSGMLALFILIFTGCSSISRQPGPAVTTMGPRVSVLPARVVSNFFVLEAKQADGKIYRFMIDTGSSTTLVSPALASALRQKEKKGPPRTVRVRGANGTEVELPTITLKEISLGDVRFARVPAVEHDFTELSVHLGLQIDGMLGFTLFRDALCTLDYPATRLELAPLPFLATEPRKATPHSATINYDNGQATPLVTVQMGNESFVVLLDSGSDGSLSLNPSGLHPRFSHAPRTGNLAATLGGDRPQLVGRLADNVSLGSFVLQEPVVDLTDQLSSLGGQLLRNFKLTFDQRRSLVTITREVDGPVQMPPRRSTGISFQRLPSYWKILSLIPDSPVSALPLQNGDLCVRINGEPVSAWDYERYTTLLKTATKVTYTFLNGAKEQDQEVPVFDLVP